MKKKESTISYEKIFDQLEKIVQKMDSGDIPLEKSLELFEQGMILIKDGKEKLDNAEARVKKLIKGQDGKLGIEDLE
jgi:exodeoxyribonuclease VII small subunit|tara:strand:- start:117 stop:347 length:231 start_codon:yes stop_codon:yes gene_type:complete